MAEVETKAYVEFRDGGYWVAGTRVSLDSLVYRWREGASPETIRSRFPALTLLQVYGALTFYLEREAEIDQYLLESEARENVIAQQLREQYPEIHQSTDRMSAPQAIAS